MTMVSPRMNAPVEAKNPNDAFADLRTRLKDRSASIAVIGLGYVGLPLAGAIHEAGFTVIGYDVDESKIQKLKAGQSYIKHLGDELTRQLGSSKRFTPTSDVDALRKADAIIICVPTPLGAHREPDLSFVHASAHLARKALRPGQLVVLESTTYPGTTRDEVRPILEESGLTFGQDFLLAFSPEREDPGRKEFTTKRIPRLVGGVDAQSGEIATLMYTQFIADVHPVASAEIAEAAKLLENIYRCVNIAMVNELKIIFDKMNINIWDVVAAASTKPYGFQPFYPGPGLGGHCIPIDPFYLTWKAKEVGYATRFIELAGEVNAGMPQYVVSRVMDAMNHDAKALRGAKVLVLGLAYKPNVDDARETPAAEIIEHLLDQGADVTYHDPHIAEFPPMRKHKLTLKSQPLTAATLKGADCVLIVTDHDAVDYALVGREAKLVVDTRNAMARVKGEIKARLVRA